MIILGFVWIRRNIEKNTKIFIVCDNEAERAKLKETVSFATPISLEFARGVLADNDS